MGKRWYFIISTRESRVLTDEKGGEFMELTDRKRLILKAVVHNFAVSSEPVGSAAIVNDYLPEVSSATVRNELAALEKLGLLFQPHTSAGRIPTNAGYRLFVDELMEKRRPDVSDMIEIQNAMQSSPDRVAGMLRDVAEVLSKVTGCMTVVTTPQMSRRKIRSVKLVRLDSFNLVLIVFAEGDAVKHSHIKLDYPVDRDLAERVSTAVNREFSGLKMEEIDERSFLRLMYEFPESPDFLGRILKLIIRAVEESAEIDTALFGTARLFDLSEYKDVTKAKQLFEFFNDGEAFGKIVTPKIEKDGITVLIGEETGCNELSDCSVSALRYLPDVSGIIAVIGSVRADYEKVASLLEYINRHLKRVLGSGNTNQLMIRRNGIFLRPIE